MLRIDSNLPSDRRSSAQDDGASAVPQPEQCPALQHPRSPQPPAIGSSIDAGTNILSSAVAATGAGLTAFLALSSTACGRTAGELTLCCGACAWPACAAASIGPRTARSSAPRQAKTAAQGSLIAMSLSTPTSVPSKAHLCGSGQTAFPQKQPYFGNAVFPRQRLTSAALHIQFPCSASVFSFCAVSRFWRDRATPSHFCQRNTRKSRRGNDLRHRVPAAPLTWFGPTFRMIGKAMGR